MNSPTSEIVDAIHNSIAITHLMRIEFHFSSLGIHSLFLNEVRILWL